MSLNHVTLWDRCLTIIRDNVQESVHNTWFVPIVPLSFENNELTIQVPTYFFYEFLEEKYIDLLQQALYRVFGKGVQLKYNVLVVKQTETTVDLESSNKATHIDNRATKAPKTVAASIFQQEAPEELDSQLNANYTFENYYSGNSNTLARSAGEAIADKPGKTAFNPLFLYGESGVGKTHLVQAIGIRIKEQDPQKRVLYVTSHIFQVQYTNAVRNNTVNDFIHFYQSIDVLLIDDIQEFASKIQTQNTFFHIFNHLHQNNKQLILTSDRPPVSLEGMVPRLLTRFKWGLTAEVERPDYELRKSILVNKIRHDGLSISDEVINFIAYNVTDNVRDLEGVIVSLMAHSTIFNREITIEMAERVLSTSVHIEKKQITMESIQEKVCQFYDLEIKALQLKSRKREIVQARQISMYLSKKYTDHSFSRIGSAIGKKDHATVLHACKTIASQIEIDKALRANILEIEDTLKR